MNSDINCIGYILHKYYQEKDYMKINELIDTFSLNHLLSYDHKGVTSILLSYYLETEKSPLCGNALYIYSNVKNLMKRDYLNLIKSIYNDDYIKAEETFYKIIMNIKEKDIIFLLENKLYRLLYCLNGMFITINSRLDTKDLNIVNMIPNNSLYYLPDMISNIMLDYIINSINNKDEIEKLNSMVACDYKVIVDGGNIIHNKDGRIDINSLPTLMNVIRLATNKIGKTLLILHQRHISTLPNLLENLRLNEINYYLTPYSKNDDLYILYMFLKLRTSYIVTNDMYKDHINNIKINDIYKKILSGVLEQQTIGNIYRYMKDTKIYSKCIQKYGNTIYIPYLNNFIKITL